MEERVHGLEIKVAVMEERIAGLISAVDKNTAAQEKVALAIASLRGGKAVIFGISVVLGSVASMLISWFKG